MLPSLLFAGVIFAAPAPADSVGALISATVEAYGGEAALRRASFRRVTGELIATRHGKEPGSFVRLLRGVGQLGVVNVFPTSGREVRLLRAGKGWRNNVEVRGMPLFGMMLQDARLAVPLNLLDGKQRVTSLGPTERDGKKLTILELSLIEGMGMRVEIDVATHRVVRTVGRIPTGRGSIEFVTDYSDFRRVDGVLFPFAERRTIMGRPAASVRVTAIEILEPKAADGIEL